MMKKWQLVLLCSAIVLFLAGNFYLLLKKDSQAASSEYIKNWITVKQEDFARTISTEGVVKPVSEEYVFFDEDSGSFNQFLVKKGDQVQAGSPLYEYTPYDIGRERESLEAQRDELESKADSLEEHIRELTSYQSTLNTSSPIGREDNSSSPDQTAYHSIEQDVLDKELQLDFIEDEIDRLNTLIAGLGTDMEQLTAVSPAEGIIKEVKQTLDNPVVTISSSQPAVYGAAAETEIDQIEQGMKAFVETSQHKKKLEGTVGTVQAFPDEEASIDKESLYPFTVVLSDENDLNTGVHAMVTVVTKESLDALGVPSKSVKTKKDAKYIWVLNGEGRIEKRETDTGLKVGKRTEIIKGAEKGEKAAANPDFGIQDNAPFFTPLKSSRQSAKELRAIEGREKIKYLLIGSIR
ncbi:efflux RND transporter periplasmic adaptor subunit [Bacillus infantis]|uniref:efflux RND transporter periplasmic adaptor subunit n=1 Tax=Bacillus infantis TaxID=324767 RepID=UPI003CF5B13E